MDPMDRVRLRFRDSKPLFYVSEEGSHLHFKKSGKGLLLWFTFDVK